MLSQIKEKAEATKGAAAAKVMDWFNSQMEGLKKTGTDKAQEDRQKQLREKEIQDLKIQQEHIAKKLAELQGQDTHQHQPRQGSGGTPGNADTTTQDCTH